MLPPLLTLEGITKRYPGVLANDGINLQVQPGQVHAILGENGAGKSTLMKIIYGVVQPDTGQLIYQGQLRRIKNPQQARQLGISMVFQHFSLFQTLTVAENVWLGLDRSQSLSQVISRIDETAREYGLDTDPMRPVHTMSVGEMQRVEIIRALLTHPKLLILDEPTSVLTPQAVVKLFDMLRLFVQQGRSVLYISHKLNEVRDLCTACTVLRAGKVSGVCDPSLETNASLSRLMIGSEPLGLQPAPLKTGPVVLRVQSLCLPRLDPFGTDLQDITFEVRAGEIVGIAGVSGNGQRELLAALSGEDPRPDHNSVHLLGQAVGQHKPAQKRSLGLHFVPEERLGRGAVPQMSLAQNMLLTRYEAVGRWGQIRLSVLMAQARAVIKSFQVKTVNEQSLAKSLSGGNLQKFIIGREISANPRLLIVSQPTWGVDVGAAAQIRTELLRLRDANCALLVVSEELDELFDLSDRLHVMAQGRVSPSISREQVTPDLVGQWMSGLWPEAAHVEV